jgi:hypothetical protein
MGRCEQRQQLSDQHEHERHAMARMSMMDKLFIEDLFDMGGGYMLDFSNRTFAEFFIDEIGVDINQEQYSAAGSSKANRLRCFLKLADDASGARAIKALWEYREFKRLAARRPEPVERAERRVADLIRTLGGAMRKVEPAAPKQAGVAVDKAQLGKLKEDLLGLHQLEAQARGYAFELFLRDLFNAFGLAAREAFRLRGEQIDGSCQLGHETYLLEAKWQNAKTGVADLHTFHGKLEQKASWTRGLFVSNSGFTEDGLAAFGRGKRLVCVDGLDLYDIMNREIPLGEALERKVRSAAETGHPFARIRDLFPDK